jgi:hypothetical protein
MQGRFLGVRVTLQPSLAGLPEALPSGPRLSALHKAGTDPDSASAGRAVPTRSHLQGLCV